MPRLAFKMQLHPGNTAEYEKRHSKLWPELEALLKGIGISDYSIFLDEETYILFGVLQVDDEKMMDTLPEHPVMKQWWAFMKDLMATNADHSPVSKPLKEVFHLA